MHTRLHSISSTSGFLENSSVEFAPGLTCIIGARGTCKSTLIESIRFAFDCEPDRVRNLEGIGENRGEPSFGLIKATLGPGSIRCELVAHSGTEESRQVLEREIGSEPRIFQDGVREHAQRDMLHTIEIFSQGDLQRIADDRNDDMRLALIDRPHKVKVARLLEERNAAAGVLRRVGPELRSLQGHIAQLRQEVQPFESLKEQLRLARSEGPNLPPELEVEHELFQRRTRIIEAVEEIEELRVDSLSHLRAIQQRAQQITAARSRIDAEASAGESGAQRSPLSVEVVEGTLNVVAAAVAELSTAAADLEALTLESSISSLVAEFESQNEAFYRLRQEQQAVNESLKQQQHLQRQVTHLERRSLELEEALQDQQRLIAERQEARGQMTRIEDEIYNLRIDEVDAINNEHGDTVYLTLRTGAGSPSYVARLSALLTGSRIHNQDQVARAIAETFSPASVIDIAESGSGQRLADVLGRDLGQMNRVVAHLSEQPELYTLEAEPPAARLEITLYDNGEPKKVETLSKGQKATALLPLILRPLPYPLLFDQPEDDLDNSFIFRSLIQAVQKLKKSRQIIFVTHNANIPVLGSADRVVVMRMRSPKQADAPLVGSVDQRKTEILELLEGGAEAFTLREQRYHELLGEARGEAAASTVPTPAASA